MNLLKLKNVGVRINVGIIPDIKMPGEGRER